MAAGGSLFGSLVLGLLVYGSGAFALLRFDLWQWAGTPISLSPRDTLAAPAAFYLLLTVTALFRRVGLRSLGIFIGRCALHVVLVITTAAALVLLQGMQPERAVALALIDLPPLVALQMLCVAMSLSTLAVPRPPSHRAKSRRDADDHASERTRSSDSVQAAPPTPAAVAPPPERAKTEHVARRPAPPVTAPRVAAAPVVTPAAAVAPPVITPPIVVTPSVVAPPVTASFVTTPAAPPVTTPAAPPAHRGEVTRHEGPTVSPVAPPVSRADAPARRAAAESAEDMVRISFERIASQLPADAFQLPLDRVGANLLEPGHLLIPRRLLAPQLGEGRARVPWSIVADQFPRQALSVPDADIAARLPDGALTLPLDEVIRQLPADTFALSSPVVDVRGIEDFPPPFQPHVPPPSQETTLELEQFVRFAQIPDGERAPVPAASIPPIAEHELQPEPEPVVFEAPVHEPVIPEPIVVEPIVVASEPAIDAEPEIESEPEPEPIRFATAVEREVERVTFREPEPPPAPFVERRRRADPGRIAGLLKPLLSALEVHEERVGRLTVLSVASPELAADAVVEGAAKLASLLDDRRLPAPGIQATVRGAQGTIVLTPLGSLADGAPLLAVAVAPGSPLAYLERAALRAVEAGALNGGRSSSMNGYADDGGDLRDTAVPPHVRTLGESFRAFGPVVPTVLQDRATSLICYMFLAPGVAARPLAQYARDLRDAMRGCALGPLESFILRMGEDRLVVREVDAGRGAAALLVAGGGPVDRLGLARLEMERAVTRLAAR